MRSRVSKLGVISLAMVVLGLALVAPTLTVTHARSPFVRTYELRFHNPTGDLNGTDANKRIKQIAQLLSPVEVRIQREVPARAILAQEPDFNLSVEIRVIRHKKIVSSPKGDPDLA